MHSQTTTELSVIKENIRSTYLELHSIVNASEYVNYEKVSRVHVLNSSNPRSPKMNEELWSRIEHLFHFDQNDPVVLHELIDYLGLPVLNSMDRWGLKTKAARVKRDVIFVFTSWATHGIGESFPSSEFRHDFEMDSMDDNGDGTYAVPEGRVVSFDARGRLVDVKETCDYLCDGGRKICLNRKVAQLIELRERDAYEETKLDRVWISLLAARRHAGDIKAAFEDLQKVSGSQGRYNAEKESIDVEIGGRQYSLAFQLSSA